MRSEHMRAWNFIATYERILNEIEIAGYTLEPFNDIDLFFIHLKDGLARPYIKETIPTPKVYRQSQVPFANLLTRLHHTKWSKTKDLNLYNFILSQINPSFTTKVELDSNLLSEIEVPEILVCSPQLYQYHI